MIDDWFPSFVTDHLSRHPAAGLPPTDTDHGAAVWKALRTSFLHKGVMDADVARTASERLVGETLRHSSHHFPRLVELAVEVYKTRQAAAGGGVPADSLEAAKLASKGCDRCGGEGLAVVWHPRPSFADRIPETVAAHCTCPAGRWTRRRWEAKDPSMLRQIPDLADVAAGRSVWREEPPAEVEPERGVRMAVVQAGSVSREGVRA